MPLGGRIKIDPWSDKLEMLKAKPVGAVAEREKMPFEVTPFMLYLTRQKSTPTAALSHRQPQLADSKAAIADRRARQHKSQATQQQATRVSDKTYPSKPERPAQAQPRLRPASSAIKLRFLALVPASNRKSPTPPDNPSMCKIWFWVPHPLRFPRVRFLNPLEGGWHGI